MSLRPLPARHYINRVDCFVKGYADDLEAGSAESLGSTAVATALPCSIQSGVPVEMMGQSVLQTNASVLVFFPSRPPVDQNDTLVQTDVAPGLKLTVVDVQDVGGLGLIWCLPCSRVE